MYELAIIGSATEDERAAITRTITEMVADFALTVGRDVQIRSGGDIDNRDKYAAFAAAYFGGNSLADSDVALTLQRSNAALIPVLRADSDFAQNIPAFLQSSNGLRIRPDDRDMTELCAAMLECVGLLRRQRRVFISYRRIESRAAAVQFHDLLAARSFDVFLDTHDIRPGDPFQDVLWHRLCDSDVMVMLDTPTYFESKWTRQELGRARAKEIHVLRVVWPDHLPNKHTDLAETIYLEREELVEPEGPIINDAAEKIILAIERLRSRSIAARHMSLTGKFRADVEKIGATVEGVGAHRAIAVRLADDRKIWAYPVVGVPSAEVLHDITLKASQANQQEMPILVYDHVGIREAWNTHMQWLDEHIKSVRAIKVAEAGWALAGLE